MKRLVFFTLIIFLQTAAHAQEVKHITGATGSYTITGAVSEEEAKSKALAEAKLNALKMAGVSENVSAYDMLFKSEVNAKYEEVFMSDKQSEIRGAVKQYTARFSKTMDEFNNFVINVSIDADVVLYKTSPDPALSVGINGIKQGYQNGEKLTFSITPSMNCYLTIFNIYDKEASLTYPNAYEKQQYLEGRKTYNFPLNPQIDYPLEKPSKEPEKNRLLFVFTKDLIPYVNFHGDEQLTNFEDVSAWIFSIPPDKRVSQYVSFVIY